MPTRKQPITEQLGFKVDSGLLFQLGEDLVSNRVTALAELVKNAYDADATKVTVTLRDTLEPGGTIVISDNGTGMDRRAVRDYWMTIATPHKRSEPYSPRYRRFRAGNKGIGRFATRRLARKLLLTTVARTTSASVREKTTVLLDWDALQPGRPIDEFTARIQSDRDSKERSGLTLELTSLRDSWTESDINSLASDLASLVEPMPERKRIKSQDPGFDVVLESSEFPNASGRLSEQFLHGAYARLKGRVAKGVAHFELRILKGPSKGRTFDYEHKAAAYERLDGARFALHYVRYLAGDFLGLPISLVDARQTGRRSGGVRVYLDGFRVPAYGATGDDWLKVDEDRANRQVTTRVELREAAGKQKRPMLALPGNNSLFGKVLLSSGPAHPFRQTLDRERLIEDADFEALRSFVRLGIDWMTVVYARLRAREAKKNKPVASVGKMLERARALVEEERQTLGDERATNIVQALALAGSAVQEQRARQISELSMLRVLASTGTMLQVFTHQLQLLLEGLRSAHQGILKAARTLPSSSRHEHEASLADLDKWIDSAEQQAHLLGVLHGRDARLRRRRIALRPFAAQLLHSFSGYMKDLGIVCDFDTDVPPQHRTPPMYEAELGAILVNLMTNALKAVKSVSDRRIAMFSERKNDQLTIHFCDSGVGADPRKWAQYFDPFMSESEPDPILGTGTGLGLKIVRDLVEMYGGHVKFIPPPKTWRTCIEVVLPEEG